MSIRIGGEIPLFSDRFGKRGAWAPNWLAFSHGRAALTWLIERRRPKSALVCAYTCPSVPTFLRRARIESFFFDVGASCQEIVDLGLRLPRPRLIILPALFGSPPWQDPRLLATSLGSSAIVVIDAAQTAFGHRDYSPPPGGATLSCPRKTTALPDGAVLALGSGLTARAPNEPPIPNVATAWKHAARALWATCKPEFESEAVKLNHMSENAWPDKPHRISDSSRILLEHMDWRWHRIIRRRNRRLLAGLLAGQIPTWRSDRGTPFNLPIFVREPAALIDQLKEQRIFATALWPDSEHDPDRHPAAAYMVRHLVSLPIDQRHDQNDMSRLGAAVLHAAAPPPPPPPSLRRMLHFTKRELLN